MSDFFKLLFCYRVFSFLCEGIILLIIILSFFYYYFSLLFCYYIIISIILYYLFIYLLFYTMVNTPPGVQISGNGKSFK